MAFRTMDVEGGMIFRTMDVACITDRTTGNGHNAPRGSDLSGRAMDENERNEIPD